MKEKTKAALIEYGICIGIELLIAFLVIWSKGFFAHSLAVNVQILADAFFVSGIMMTLIAGLMYISGEGALIGISYVLRNAFLAFVPMGRSKHEMYGKYRERKLKKLKKGGTHCMIVTGLVFLFIGVVLTLVWSKVFYNV